MSPQRRLEAKLAEEYELLAQFEELERTAANPRQRLEYQQEIKRQREVIQSIQEEFGLLTDSVSIGDSPQLTAALAKEVQRQLWLRELKQLQEREQSIQLVLQEKEIIAQNAQEAEETLISIIAQASAVPQRHERYATFRAEMNVLESEQPRLRDQMVKLKDRLDRLEAETGGECPLCGQSLSEDHRRAALVELQREGRELGERFRLNRQRLEVITAELEALKDDLRRDTQLERDQRVQQQRLAQTEARQAEIEQIIADWQKDGAERLAELEALLGVNFQNEILANLDEKYHQAVQVLLMQMGTPELKLLTALMGTVSKQELAQWQGENLINLTRHAVRELKESGRGELDTGQWCELLAGLEKDKDWEEALKLTLPLVPAILKQERETSDELWQALNDAWNLLVGRVTKE